MLSIALSEQIQIFRNRSVLITSFVMSIAVSAFFIYRHDIFAEIGSLGYTDDLTLLKRLLPGGSATELVANAWNGGVAVADSLLLLAPTLTWVVVAAALSSRLFRWEPRR